MSEFARYKGENEFTTNEFNYYINNLKFQDWKPSLITVHHTWKPELKDWHGMKSLDALERFYRDVNKWHSGPHFYVTDKYWYLFTPATREGVHAIKFNHNAWGVEVVHNGDAAPFQGEQAKNLYSGLATMFKKIGVNPQTGLRFHRDDPKAFKTCPGLKVTKSAVLQGIFDNGYSNKPVLVEPHPLDKEEIDIFYKGEMLKTKAKSVDGMAYVPLKSICDELGIQVEYKPGLHPYVGVIYQNKRVNLTGEITIHSGTSWIGVRGLTENLNFICIFSVGQIHIQRKT